MLQRAQFAPPGGGCFQRRCPLGHVHGKSKRRTGLQISNRYIQVLESPLSYGKQKVTIISNRYKLEAL